MAFESLKNLSAESEEIVSGESLVSSGDETSGGSDDEGGAKAEHGLITIPLPTLASPDFGIVERRENLETIGYDFYIGSLIGCDAANEVATSKACSILEHAESGTETRIYLNSFGGSVQTAARLISSMKRSKSHIKTIACGNVISAGTFIWAEGAERIIHPASTFMFHASSHGSYGKTSAVAQNAEIMEAYVKDIILEPMMKSGILTSGEYQMILSGEDVVIPGLLLQARLDEKSETGDDE